MSKGTQCKQHATWALKHHNSIREVVEKQQNTKHTKLKNLQVWEWRTKRKEGVGKKNRKNEKNGK